MKRPVATAVLVAFGLAFAMPALAQGAGLSAPEPAVQGLLDMIIQSANSWDGSLRRFGMSIFWSLATIQFVITMIPLAIRSGDLSEIWGELVRFILTIGFFAALLLHSADWAKAIIDSFRIAGASAAGLGGTGLKPGDMFGTAVELANTMNDVETWNPLTAVAIAVSALIVLLCFAFVAALMFVTLVESYIVINASVLFMGFGGSSWTREYSIAILRYAVSVGAKLFVLTLLVGIVLSSAKQWQAAYTNDSGSMLTLVGLALVCAYLCKTLPDMIQGVISGVSPGGGGMLGSMAGIAAVSASAAAAALTGGAAGGLAGGAAGGFGGGGAGGAAGGAAGGGLSGLGSLGGMGGSLAQSMAGHASSGARSALGPGGSSEGGGSIARSLGQRIGGAPSASQSPASAMNGISGTSPTQTGGSNTGQSGQAAAQTGEGADNGSVEDSAQASPEDPAPGSAPTDGNRPSDTGLDRSSATSSQSGAGRMIASGAMRTTGTLAALAVPGMENAAAMSLGPPAPTFAPDGGGLSDASFEGGNTIAPAASDGEAASAISSGAEKLIGTPAHSEQAAGASLAPENPAALAPSNPGSTTTAPEASTGSLEQNAAESGGSLGGGMQNNAASPTGATKPGPGRASAITPGATASAAGAGSTVSPTASMGDAAQSGSQAGNLLDGGLPNNTASPADTSIPQVGLAPGIDSGSIASATGAGTAIPQSDRASAINSGATASSLETANLGAPATPQTGGIPIGEGAGPQMETGSSLTGEAGEGLTGEAVAQQNGVPSGSGTLTSGEGQTPPSPRQNEDQASSGPSGINHMLASGAVRSMGMLAALSVPGMEAASAMSLGPAPLNSGNGNTGDESEGEDDFVSRDTGNIIQPMNVTDTASSFSAPIVESPTNADGGDIMKDDSEVTK